MEYVRLARGSIGTVQLGEVSSEVTKNIPLGNDTPSDLTITVNTSVVDDRFEFVSTFLVPAHSRVEWPIRFNPKNTLGKVDYEFELERNDGVRIRIDVMGEVVKPRVINNHSAPSNTYRAATQDAGLFSPLQGRRLEDQFRSPVSIPERSSILGNAVTEDIGFVQPPVQVVQGNRKGYAFEIPFTNVPVVRTKSHEMAPPTKPNAVIESYDASKNQQTFKIDLNSLDNVDSEIEGIASGFRTRVDSTSNTNVAHNHSDVIYISAPTPQRLRAHKPALGKDRKIAKGQEPPSSATNSSTQSEPPRMNSSSHVLMFSPPSKIPSRPVEQISSTNGLHQTDSDGDVRKEISASDVSGKRSTGFLLNYDFTTGPLAPKPDLSKARGSRSDAECEVRVPFPSNPVERNRQASKSFKGVLSIDRHERPGPFPGSKNREQSPESLRVRINEILGPLGLSLQPEQSPGCGDSSSSLLGKLSVPAGNTDAPTRYVLRSSENTFLSSSEAREPEEHTLAAALYSYTDPACALLGLVPPSGRPAIRPEERGQLDLAVGYVNILSESAGLLVQHRLTKVAEARARAQLHDQSVSLTNPHKKDTASALTMDRGLLDLELEIAAAGTRLPKDFDPSRDVGFRSILSKVFTESIAPFWLAVALDRVRSGPNSAFADADDRFCTSDVFLRAEKCFHELKELIAAPSAVNSKEKGAKVNPSTRNKILNVRSSRSGASSTPQKVSSRPFACEFTQCTSIGLTHSKENGVPNNTQSCKCILHTAESALRTTVEQSVKGYLFQPLPGGRSSQTYAENFGRRCLARAYTLAVAIGASLSRASNCRSLLEPNAAALAFYRTLGAAAHAHPLLAAHAARLHLLSPPPLASAFISPQASSPVSIGVEALLGQINSAARCHSFEPEWLRPRVRALVSDWFSPPAVPLEISLSLQLARAPLAAFLRKETRSGLLALRLAEAVESKPGALTLNARVNGDGAHVSNARLALFTLSRHRDAVRRWFILDHDPRASSQAPAVSSRLEARSRSASNASVGSAGSHRSDRSIGVGPTLLPSFHKKKAVAEAPVHPEWTQPCGFGPQGLPFPNLFPSQPLRPEALVRDRNPLPVLWALLAAALPVPSIDGRALQAEAMELWAGSEVVRGHLEPDWDVIQSAFLGFPAVGIASQQASGPSKPQQDPTLLLAAWILPFCSLSPFQIQQKKSSNRIFSVNNGRALKHRLGDSQSSPQNHYEPLLDLHAIAALVHHYFPSLLARPPLPESLRPIRMFEKDRSGAVGPGLGARPRLRREVGLGRLLSALRAEQLALHALSRALTDAGVPRVLAAAVKYFGFARPLPTQAAMLVLQYLAATIFPGALPTDIIRTTPGGVVDPWCTPPRPQPFLPALSALQGLDTHEEGSELPYWAACVRAVADLEEALGNARGRPTAGVLSPVPNPRARARTDTGAPHDASKPLRADYGDEANYPRPILTPRKKASLMDHLKTPVRIEMDGYVAVRARLRRSASKTAQKRRNLQDSSNSVSVVSPLREVYSEEARELTATYLQAVWRGYLVRRNVMKHPELCRIVDEVRDFLGITPILPFGDPGFLNLMQDSPVSEEIKGNPRFLEDHAAGTHTNIQNRQLDYISDSDLEGDERNMDDMVGLEELHQSWSEEAINEALDRTFSATFGANTIGLLEIEPNTNHTFDLSSTLLFSSMQSPEPAARRSDDRGRGLRLTSLGSPFESPISRWSPLHSAPSVEDSEATAFHMRPAVTSTSQPVSILGDHIGGLKTMEEKTSTDLDDSMVPFSALEASVAPPEESLSLSNSLLPLSTNHSVPLGMVLETTAEINNSLETSTVPPILSPQVYASRSAAALKAQYPYPRGSASDPNNSHAVKAVDFDRTLDVDIEGQNLFTSTSAVPASALPDNAAQRQKKTVYFDLDPMIREAESRSSRESNNLSFATADEGGNNTTLQSSLTQDPNATLQFGDYELVGGKGQSAVTIALNGNNVTQSTDMTDISFASAQSGEVTINDLDEPSTVLNAALETDSQNNSYDANFEKTASESTIRAILGSSATSVPSSNQSEQRLQQSGHNLIAEDLTQSKGIAFSRVSNVIRPNFAVHSDQHTLKEDQMSLDDLSSSNMGTTRNGSFEEFGSFSNLPKYPQEPEPVDAEILQQLKDSTVLHMRAVQSGDTVKATAEYNLFNEIMSRANSETFSVFEKWMSEGHHKALAFGSSAISFPTVTDTESAPSASNSLPPSSVPVEESEDMDETVPVIPPSDASLLLMNPPSSSPKDEQNEEDGFDEANFHSPRSDIHDNKNLSISNRSQTHSLLYSPVSPLSPSIMHISAVTDAECSTPDVNVHKNGSKTSSVTFSGSTTNKEQGKAIDMPSPIESLMLSPSSTVVVSPGGLDTPVQGSTNVEKNIGDSLANGSQTAASYAQRRSLFIPPGSASGRKVAPNAGSSAIQRSEAQNSAFSPIPKLASLSPGSEFNITVADTVPTSTSAPSNPIKADKGNAWMDISLSTVSPQNTGSRNDAKLGIYPNLMLEATVVENSFVETEGYDNNNVVVNLKGTGFSDQLSDDNTFVAEPESTQTKVLDNPSGGTVAASTPDFIRSSKPAAVTSDGITTSMSVIDAEKAKERENALAVKPARFLSSRLSQNVNGKAETSTTSALKSSVSTSVGLFKSRPKTRAPPASLLQTVSRLDDEIEQARLLFGGSTQVIDSSKQQNINTVDSSGNVSSLNSAGSRNGPKSTLSSLLHPPHNLDGQQLLLQIQAICVRCNRGEALTTILEVETIVILPQLSLAAARGGHILLSVQLLVLIRMQLPAVVSAIAAVSVEGRLDPVQLFATPVLSMVQYLAKRCSAVLDTSKSHSILGNVQDLQKIAHSTIAIALLGEIVLLSASPVLSSEQSVVLSRFMQLLASAKLVEVVHALRRQFVQHELEYMKGHREDAFIFQDLGKDLHRFEHLARKIKLDAIISSAY